MIRDGWKSSIASDSFDRLLEGSRLANLVYANGLGIFIIIQGNASKRPGAITSFSFG